MNHTSPRRRLTGFQLKYIALASMAIDHAAAVFLPGTALLYRILRGIGRIAFPLYCFLLAEGYRHTSNKRAYLTRLLFFALISEIPFDMAFYHFPQVRSWSLLLSHQNVFFTLSFAFLSIWFLDHFWFTNRSLGVFLACLPAIAAECGNFDYGLSGVAVVMIFFLWQRQQPGSSRVWMTVLACLPILPADTWGACIFLTVPLILFYDGSKGTPLPGNRDCPAAKYLFYAFYPLHLLLLGISWFLFF